MELENIFDNNEELTDFINSKGYQKCTLSLICLLGVRENYFLNGIIEAWINKLIFNYYDPNDVFDLDFLNENDFVKFIQILERNISKNGPNNSFFFRNSFDFNMSDNLKVYHDYKEFNTFHDLFEGYHSHLVESVDILNYLTADLTNSKINLEKIHELTEKLFIKYSEINKNINSGKILIHGIIIPKKEEFERIFSLFIWNSDNDLDFIFFNSENLVEKKDIHVNHKLFIVQAKIF